MAIVTPKSIFFHVPKTGGMWVTKVLKKMFENRVLDIRQGRKDKRLNLRQEHIPPDFINKKYLKGKFKYCFVRNPLNWYKSLWNYKERNGWREYYTVVDRKARNLSFNDFVLKVIELFPKGYYTEKLKHFVPFCDFVGKTERIKRDLKKVLDLAGEDYDKKIIKEIPPENVSNSHLVCYFNDDVKKKLMKVEKWVFDKFGYTEDESLWI